MLGYSAFATAPISALSATVPVFATVNISGVSCTTGIGSATVSTIAVTNVTSISANALVNGVTISGIPRFLPQSGLITNNIVDQNFGIAVGLSSDGNTMAIGASGSDSHAGRVYIYTRSSGVWSQQTILYPSGAGYSPSDFGNRVSLSDDGNTLAVSGFAVNISNSAVWIFTRSGTTWSLQQGPITSGSSMLMWFGYDISIDGSGNNLVITAPKYLVGSIYTGAMYVYTRSGSTWSLQQGPITPTDGIGTYPQIGESVSISGDSNTIAATSVTDNSNKGALWIYTKSAGVWSKQAKITPSAVSSAFGNSTVISTDGNRVAAGGSQYLWVFTRSGTTWTTYSKSLSGQSTKYIAMDGSGSLLGFGPGYPTGFRPYTFNGAIFSEYGGVVTETTPSVNSKYAESSFISRDGSTLVVGAWLYNPNVTGAAWVYINVETIEVHGVYSSGIVGNLSVGVGDTVQVSGLLGTTNLGSANVTVVANQTITPTGLQANAYVGDISTSISVPADVSNVSCQGNIGDVNVLTGTIVNITGVQGLCVSNFVYVSISPNISITGVLASGAVNGVTTTGSSTANINTQPISAIKGNISVISNNIIDITSTALTGVLGAVTVDSDNVANVQGFETSCLLGDVTLITDIYIETSEPTINGYIGNVVVGENTEFQVDGVYASGILGVVTAGSVSGVDVVGVMAKGTLGSVAAWVTVNDQQTSNWTLVNTLRN